VTLLTDTGHHQLEVDFCGLPFATPLVLLSGCVGFGEEYTRVSGFSNRDAGAVCLKGTTLEPRLGNPPHRIAETPMGMLNAIGLENVGVDAFVAEKLPQIPDGVPVVASVFGTSPAEYVEVCKRLTGVPKVAGLELNASCPHVKAGGIEFGQNPELLAGLVRECRSATSLPLLVKLSPNVTSIAEMARVAEGEGADGLALINTLQALDVDLETRRPVLRNVLGGLSGPAIGPVALRMVWQVAQATGIPIIGIGGIMSAEDALEFFIAGATAIQVGTANFVNPHATTDIIDGIEKFLLEKNIEKISDVIGTLET